MDIEGLKVGLLIEVRVVRYHSGFIDIVGLDNAKEKAKNLTENALNSINNYQIDNKDILIDLAKYLVERKN